MFADGHYETQEVSLQRDDRLLTFREWADGMRRTAPKTHSMKTGDRVLSIYVRERHAQSAQQGIDERCRILVGWGRAVRDITIVFMTVA
jgi:hypothetical protein